MTKAALIALVCTGYTPGSLELAKCEQLVGWSYDDRPAYYAAQPAPQPPPPTIIRPQK